MEMLNAVIPPPINPGINYTTGSGLLSSKAPDTDHVPGLLGLFVYPALF
jgi:hypothetical protein